MFLRQAVRTGLVGLRNYLPSSITSRIQDSTSTAYTHAPSSDPDEDLPLHPLSSEAVSPKPDHPPIPSHGPDVLPSCATLPVIRRFVLGAFACAVIYHIIDYVYTDPLRWDNSWSEAMWGPTPLALSHIVYSSGRKYVGVEDASGNTFSWRGVPYAQTPKGRLRFRTAVPLEEVAGREDKVETVYATEYDEGCPRYNMAHDGFDGTEDCLSLNIHSPTVRLPDSLLPVMVWIHGGGFYAGAPHEERYDPTDLLERSFSMNQPFIFVSIGYRLGLLGFSSSPPRPGGGKFPAHVPIQPPENFDLNIGLKDQLEALKWIRKNIEAFGGDKEKVTLVGHSAGAMSAGLHILYSPSDLFRGAFMLSGAPTSFPVPYPHDASARTLHPLPGPAGCPSPVGNGTSPPINTELIACLRNLPLSFLMQAQRGIMDRAPNNGYFPWYPVLEGDFEGSWLDFRPSDRIVRGTFSKVPVVMGAVKDEGTRFVTTDLRDQQGLVDGIRGAFEFTFGAIEGILEPLWELYPDDPEFGSPYDTGNKTFGLSPSFKRLASILGDVFFQAPRRHFLRETAKDFGEPAWNYYYDEKRPGAPDYYGSQHGADLQSWFGHPETQDPSAHHLSRHMAAYLINFVANLDPNGPGLRSWPQYGMERKTLHLAPKKIVVTHDNDRLEAMRFLNVQMPLFAK